MAQETGACVRQVKDGAGARWTMLQATAAGGTPHREGRMERVEYLIIGAGQAGLTLQRVLQSDRTVLVDPDPCRYKIGESIVPEQFQHPVLHELLPDIHRMPCYVRKEGVTFIAGDSVASFPLLPKNREESMHVEREALERLMIERWKSEIRRERVTDIDFDARRVRTDANEYLVDKQILDCSGPAMVVASKLDEIVSLRPIHAAWGYFDVTAIDDARFRAVHGAAGRRFVHYDARRRQVLPGEHVADWSPSHTTILTALGPGLWCWQIPLYDRKLLSFGVVSRQDPPLTADDVRALAHAHHAPCYELADRPQDRSTPYNRVHFRSGFARRAKRAASMDWVLIGDAFAFADPIYSVGTALAVNKAVEVANQLNEHGWTPEACAGYCRGADELLVRAAAAFDFWYTGEVVSDDAAAREVQEGWLVGNAFQTESLQHYGNSLDAASLQSGEGRDDTQALDLARGSLRPQVLDLLGLGQDGALAGWLLQDAHACTDGLYLAWTAPDHPELIMLILHDESRVGEHFRRQGPLGLSYMSRWSGDYPFDHDVEALFAAALKSVAGREARWVALHRG